MQELCQGISRQELYGELEIYRDEGSSGRGWYYVLWEK